MPVRPKTMLFSSFGGRKFDDSPKAVYDEICRRPEFSDWTLTWAFTKPERFTLSRGEKVQVDTLAFFQALLSSQVWVGNSGIDRGIGLKRKGVVRVETWHGAPLKKICGEENNATVGRQKKHRGPLDGRTIRCAQSEFDRSVFQRVFHAEERAFLLCGLPRNDALFRYTPEDIAGIREKLGIPVGKKAILYTPTYREYLLDENHDTYIAPPMDLAKWEAALGADYVLLFRAHYAVTAALGLRETAFLRDVSRYPVLNDLYAAADLMISDYSSTFFDYSVLDRPMLCFAYDLEEYREKRGLYLDLAEALPCPVDREEDTLLERIWTLDAEACSRRTRAFHQRFAPWEGRAAQAVVDEIERRLSQ
nr:CDP-glycerol glycerophosphotransferase family protein [uncultured Oscillibacter sp.]